MSANDFISLSKIGEGSYSSVHKVKRISDGKIYALKKVKMNNLKEKQKQNALNQVRLLASISNDFIIAYKQAFFDAKDKALCIVMEYADGGDLQKIIDKKKKSLTFVQESQVWKMARQILTGLSVLHDMKIIHRDIKCANIFINEGQYKLGDLNVSKLLKKALAYTQTGTPYYASPQVWKDKPYELKSDIWSLGCIVYEFCSLKPPFTAQTMDGLYKKVLKGAFPRIPHTFSRKLQDFIAKCLQQNPKDRPTAKQLLKMIPDQEDEFSEVVSNINLLNTIKVPLNLQRLQDDLPKSNYDNKSFKSAEEGEKQRGRFHHVSQKRLKEIVRLKQEQNVRVKTKVSPDFQKPHSNIHQNNNNNNQYHTLGKKKEMLPKLKVYSQPSDQIHVIKVKDDERKKYPNYYRPVWWG